MHTRHEARWFRVVVGRWGIVAGLVLAVLMPALPPAQSVQAATRTVTKVDDDNTAGTLRFEISHALENDTITFAPGLTGTIVLDAARGQLVLAQNVTITGPGATSIFISGNNAVNK